MKNFGNIPTNTNFAFGDLDGDSPGRDHCIKFIKGPGSITVDLTPNGYTVTLEALLNMKCLCESFPDKPSIGGLGAWPQGCKGNKYDFYISRSYPGKLCSLGEVPSLDVKTVVTYPCRGNKHIKIKETMSMADFIAGSVGWEQGLDVDGNICIVVTPANQAMVLALWLCGANYSRRPGRKAGEPPFTVLCFNMYKIAECMGQAIFGKLLCEDSNEDTVADFITAFMDGLNRLGEFGNCSRRTDPPPLK